MARAVTRVEPYSTANGVQCRSTCNAGTAAGSEMACAATGSARRSWKPGRGRTWINARIRTLYRGLYERGHCHTVEAYDTDDRLVGGLYGVSLGRAFFGESMFHEARDASKVALVHLIARLRAGGFRLLDAQFVTEHLQQFGAIEISRSRYHACLAAAIPADANFYELGGAGAAVGEGTVLQLITQTS